MATGASRCSTCPRCWSTTCCSPSNSTRAWCRQAGRTPRADEQQAIACQQQALIDAAAAQCDVVVCDTTALMTAVYSAMLFGDESLQAYAVAQHRRCDITLLTALDLPWVPDGFQRDGPQVREPVDARVRALLLSHGLPWSPVAGVGERRTVAALEAVSPLLPQHGQALSRYCTPRGLGG